MDYKRIDLTIQRSKTNDKMESYKYEPFTVAFNYVDYPEKIPTEVLIEKLDMAYKKLKEHLIMELEND